MHVIITHQPFRDKLSNLHAHSKWKCPRTKLSKSAFPTFRGSEIYANSQDQPTMIECAKRYPRLFTLVLCRLLQDFTLPHFRWIVAFKIVRTAATYVARTGSCLASISHAEVIRFRSYIWSHTFAGMTISAMRSVPPTEFIPYEYSTENEHFDWLLIGFAIQPTVDTANELGVYMGSRRGERAL